LYSAVGNCPINFVLLILKKVIMNSTEQSPSSEHKGYSVAQPFMESKGSLPYSQEFATGTDHDPNESSPNIHTIFQIYINIILISMHRFSMWSLPFRVSG
jgi:hypothetical protein